WSTLNGTVSIQVIEALAVFGAAILAGGGQPRPLVVGSVLGALNGLLLIVSLVVMRQPIDPLLYALPFVHSAVAAVGSHLGAQIWQPSPPLPALAAATGPGQKQLVMILPEEPEFVEDEAFPWLRFVIGTLIAVAGTFGARWIREFFLLVGGG